MIRVPTARSYSSALLNIQRNQATVDQSLREVGTGMKGSDLKAFATRSETLIASRAVQVRTDAHVANSQALKARLAVQDQALDRVTKGANAAVTAVTKALANNDGGALMAELQTAMDQAVGGLNTSYAGGYLFSGGRVDTAPVTITQLGDLGDPPAPPAPPPPPYVRPDPFANGQLVAQSRLDDSTVVTTGVLAEDVGGPLLGALADVAEYEFPSFGAPLTDDQHAFLTDLLSKLSAAAVTATDAQARNGAIQKQVDQSIEDMKGRQELVANLIGDITEVDPLEAAARLQMAQTTMEASAKAFSTLKNSSLLQFLQS